MSCPKKIQVVFLFLCLLVPTTVWPVDDNVYWEIYMSISVQGSYSYEESGNRYDGQYSFKIESIDSMAHDMDADYVLCWGDKKIRTLNWTETVVNKTNNTATTLSLPGMKPGGTLNYVLRRDGILYFDFELFLDNKDQPGLKSKFPQKLFLPRSEINKNIHGPDRYNKYVVKGSNRIELKEKPILLGPSATEAFNWQWQRDKNFTNQSHSVQLEITINKRTHH